MGMRSALRLIPLMVIGAVAAFLLAGPLTSFYKTHAVASRPQPSASSTVDPHASPTTCPASLPMPSAKPSVASSTPALPFPVWVNDPLGVNLRSAASASSARLATLTQGTQATADGRAPDASGNTWYHVTLGTQGGWVRSDFVVTTALHAASGSGWSLMLPQGYQLAPSSNASLTTVTKTGDDLPFLRLGAIRHERAGPDDAEIVRSLVARTYAGDAAFRHAWLYERNPHGRALSWIA